MNTPGERFVATYSSDTTSAVLGKTIETLSELSAASGPKWLPIFLTVPGVPPARTRNRCLLDQLIRVTHGNCQVRAAKVTENSEVHADDLAAAIEERSAGTAGGCRCIVDNLVR